MDSNVITQYEKPNLKLRKKLNTLSQNNLDYCYQCSTCSGICPINMVSSYNPRELIHLGQLGLEFNSEDIERLWRCTTCAACEVICPKEVKLTDIFAAFRSQVVEDEGKIPYTYTKTLQSFYTYGNPFNLRSAERSDWAKGLNVPVAKKGTEILYFVGCTASYDPRSQKIAKALSSIFNTAKIDFGIGGKDERECGNCVNFMGESVLADYEREKNEKIIQEIQPVTIVTTSPHSFNRIKNDYNLPSGTEVVHYTKFLDRLNTEGKLEFKESATEKLVTYHDACYLGRHNAIFNQPRRVLEAIPGVNLVEMENNKEMAMCCGGGGGNVWAETKVEERLSIPRLNEALESRATTLATACYFCLIMFEDAVKVTNHDNDISVMDIAEIVSEALIDERKSW
ncbi:MAG: (Fe-S)-binding protein [Candidatus Hodarchaeales archaeon]|jgi:Fe-S oxidoreductase